MSTDSQDPVSYTIDSKELFRLLTGKGVSTFHHANTAKTALTFISEGALLSRAYVENNGLFQTEQYTDEKDKKLDIWDAVFVDGLDLHEKFSRRNKYGPVLFHMDLKMLLSEDFPFVRVTKNNPANWSLIETNFYSSIEDIDKDYLTGNDYRDGGIMFLFDKPEKKLALNTYCTKIIVDDPRITLVCKDQSQRPISELVKATMENTLKENGLHNIPVQIRHPDLSHCSCYLHYKMMYNNNKEAFDKLFSKK
ncbi:hypothetical protein [Flavihumibacter sp.]|uniref:hypothetical protein n=1 Tax=Flavihumibacter sp. TaxID=1913981 RepID=UPI002FC65A15